MGGGPTVREWVCRMRLTPEAGPSPAPGPAFPITLVHNSLCLPCEDSMFGDTLPTKPNALRKCERVCQFLLIKDICTCQSQLLLGARPPGKRLEDFDRVGGLFLDLLTP